MGIYAITGASSGIGAKTKELLEADGNRVINIDLKGGDICVNLASEAGRQKAIDELHRLCPDGAGRYDLQCRCIRCMRQSVSDRISELLRNTCHCQGRL